MGLHAGTCHISKPRARRGATLLSLLLVAGWSGAAAQESAPSLDASPDLWYAITAGGAGMRLTCDLCQPARDLGPAVTVSVGAHAGDDLRVGLEAGGWTHEQGTVRERMYTLGLVAHLVPDRTRGLYLLGGFGWTGYRSGDFSYDAPRMTVGLGWDVPLSGAWSVGNIVALDASSFASLRNGDATVVRNVGLSSLRVAVQLRRN
jgi:hypothetical protein